MQIVSVPLFNNTMTVEAYLFRCREGNELFPAAQATSIFDNAMRSSVLETLNYVGIDAFTLGKPIFIPIKSIMLLSNLGAQCSQPPELVVFLLEDAPGPALADECVSRMSGLRALGYRFAAGGVSGINRHASILRECSFFLLPQSAERAAHSARVLDELKRNYRHIVPVAEDVENPGALKTLYGKGYRLFESRFLKVSDTAGAEISPLKMNSVRLLNTVQNDDFEFDEVARIVQGDPALAVSLLRMVNARAYGSNNKIKSIQQAVAMLGQREVRKWVTTAVAQSLGNDRPGEITKVSLIRAKFAENLAVLFELAHMSQGLFLMGLFSVLDVILEVPMEKALEMVSLSDLIQKALIGRGGVYYPVLNMLVSYETADWVTVSRLMIVHEISPEELSKAYIDAIVWYKNIVTFDPDLPETEPEAGEA